MLLFRWMLPVCGALTLALTLSCSGGDSGGSGGTSLEPRLSVPRDKGEEDPVVTVKGPFKQNVTIELFFGKDCQGDVAGNLPVTASQGNHQQEGEVTHEEADIGAYIYSVGVTTQGERECIEETIRYSKLPPVPTAVVASKALDFGGIVEITVEGVAAGGVAVLYSDKDCSVEINRISLGSTQITLNNLAESVHHFYAAVEKNNVTSTCSATPARYERRRAIVYEFNPALSSPGQKKSFAIKGSGGVAGGDDFSFYTESSCQTSVGAVRVVSDGEVTVNIALGVGANDGVHQFYVKFTKSISAEQSIGSPCVDSNLSYTLDTTVGSISALALITRSPSNEAKPQFRATVSGVISQDVITLYQSGDCTGNPAMTMNVEGSANSVILQPSSPLTTDGDYSFSAKVSDAAGNVSSCAAIADPYVYNSSATNRPVITLASPASSPGNDNNPSFTVTNVLSGDTVKIYDNLSCLAAALVGQATASGTSATVSLTSVLSGDGDYTFYATTTTAGGEVSGCSYNPASYTLDATPPVSPAVSVVDSSPGKNPTPVVRVASVVQDDIIRVYTNANCTADKVGQQTVPPHQTTVDIITDRLADATYTFYAQASDLVGNTSGCIASQATYLLDTVSPSIPTVALVTATPSNNPTPIIRVSGVEAESTVKLYRSVNCQDEVASETVPAGNTTIDLTSSVLQVVGSYSFSAKAIDPASNESTCSSGVAYSLMKKVMFLPKISAGSSHTCAVNTVGNVYCWGKGSKGQIGNNAKENKYRPTLVNEGEDTTNSLGGILQVSSGEEYTCGLTSTGKVKCWGKDFRGQLGDRIDNFGTGSEAPKDFPVDVLADVTGNDPLSGVVQISSGKEHVCAVTTEGQVRCWGSDCGPGQLGVGGECSKSKGYARNVKRQGGNNLDGIAQVSAGGEHTCALSMTGQVWCWGKNDSEQLGGTGGDSGVANLVPSLSEITQISAGDEHTCGLISGGGVKCWGKGNDGRLGHNAETGGVNPVVVTGIGGAGTLSNIIQISAGLRHTCALNSNRQVLCWGYGGDGRLGNNGEVNSLSPVLVLGADGQATNALSGIVQISTGNDHSCALDFNGQARCWGQGDYGRLGYGLGSKKLLPTRVVVPTMNSLQGLNIGSYQGGYSCLGSSCNLERIKLALSSPTSSPGESSSLTIRVSGIQQGENVKLYPDSECAQAQVGNTANAGSPTVSVVNLAEQEHKFYFKVESGGASSLCSKSYLSYERDGTAPTQSPSIAIIGASRGLVPIPILVSNLNRGDIVQVYKNSNCSNASDKVGEFRAEGGILRGLVGVQLTHGSYNFYAKVVDDAGNGSSCSVTPASYTVVEGLWFISKKIGSGLRHSCSVMANGTVKCWGEGSNGQLGQGATTARNYPVSVVGVGGSGTLGNIVQVSTGLEHSCGLTSGGQVNCWGKGAHGRLGNGASIDSNHPVAVKNIAGTGTLSGIVQISGGDAHTCAVTSATKVVCWGKGGNGRLGHGAVSDSSLPVVAKGPAGGGGVELSQIVQVGTGSGYTCALATSGRVACWGRGHHGQLGNNATADSNIPVYVFETQSSAIALSGIAQISVGWDHSCALTWSSEVKCWGRGEEGRLGDRGTSNKSYPVSVFAGETGSGLLTNIVQISSGWGHSCAVSSDSRVKCWGRGDQGQLGNNRNDNVGYPVDVVFEDNPLSNIVELSVGREHTCALSSKNQVQCWGKGANGELGSNENINSSTPVIVVADNGSTEPLAIGTFWQGYDCLVDICRLGKIFIAKRSAVINNAGNGVNLTLSISGLLPGEIVRIYSDTACSTQVGGDATASASSVQINDLVAEGHRLYFDVSKDGSTSSCSRNYFSYFVDVVAPPAPTGVSLVGAPPSFVTNPTLRVAGVTIGDTVYIYTDASCSDASRAGGIRVSAQIQDIWLNSPLGAAGDYTFYAKAVDDAGNASACSTASANYTFDPLLKSQFILGTTNGNYSHRCSVMTNGEVKCWGRGNNGQLGQGAKTASNYPVSVVGVGGSGTLENIVQVSTGEDYSCGLNSIGEVYCWGRGASGRLGNGVTTGSNYPIAVKNIAGTGTLSGIVQISSGKEHTCALTSAMAVVCWGKGGGGRLGHGSLADSSRPVAVKGLNGVGTLSSIVQVSVGDEYTCALSVLGEVMCWGRGNVGQLGNNATADSKTPVSVFEAQNSAVALGDIVQVSAGGSHSCALTGSGKVKCWGGGGEGRLGDRETSNKSYPVSVFAGETGSGLLANIVQISSGGSHSCAVASNAQVKCWGQGAYGALGSNNTDNKTYPVDAVLGNSPLSDVVEVSSGAGHTCALIRNGNVKCWGKGNDGQLGTKQNTQSLYPMPVVADDGAIGSLVTTTFQRRYDCSSTACVLDGIVLAQGNVVVNTADSTATLAIAVSGVAANETANIYSDATCGTQVGANVTTDPASIQTASLSEGSHRFYFKRSGAACSKNYLSYVVDATAPAAPSAVSLQGASPSSVAIPMLRVTGVTIGDTVYIYTDASCSIASRAGGIRVSAQTQDIQINSPLGAEGDYKFYAKAVDGVGNESGCSTNFASYTYRPVKFQNFLASLTLGAAHSCAVVAGKVKCWGEGGDGQLGHDATTDANAPVFVKSSGGSEHLLGIVQLSAGAKHTCGLTSGGYVKCWGKGANGRLGHNAVTDSVSPVGVKNVAGTEDLGNIVQISSGREHTCALTSAMAVVCWGKGDNGRLGHGAVSDSSLPVAVKDLDGERTLSNIVQVSVGTEHSCALSFGGQVLCWGKGSNGQLGNRQNSDKSRPVSVFAGPISTGTMLLGNITQISTGGDYTCALTIGGKARCWGGNWAGKLGNRQTSNRNYPVSVYAGENGNALLTDIVQVKSASGHSCALLLNGRVKCWGHGSYGKLGNDSDSNKGYPVDVVLGGNPLSNIVEVSVGRDHSCALSTSNQVKCWGKGTSGQLGDRRNRNDRSPVTVITDYKTPHALSVNTFQRHYACLTDCAIGAVSIVGWSPNPGKAVNFEISANGIPGGKSVKFYSNSSCGTEVGAAATSSSVVTIAGLSPGSHRFYFKVINSDGSDSTSCSKTFFSYILNSDNTAPTVPSGVSMEATGSASFLTMISVSVTGLTTGDVVYVYRGSSCSEEQRMGWAHVTGDPQIVDIDRLTSLGSYRYYARAVDDARNKSACSASFASYTLTEFVRTSATLSLGKHLGCAVVSAEGKVKCWGKGGDGALGSGNLEDQLRPGFVKRNEEASPGSFVEGDLIGVGQIATGDDTVCVLRPGQAGPVKCWGGGYVFSNTHINNINFSSISSSPVEVTAGQGYACALFENGKVGCWGRGTHGRLGIPVNPRIVDAYKRKAMGLILSLDNVVQIASQYFHACALTNEGKVACWGDGEGGDWVMVRITVVTGTQKVQFGLKMKMGF